MRTLIDTADHTRFRISQEDLPVVWDQLEPLDHLVMRLDTYDDHLKIKGIKREDSDDVYEYIIGFRPLTITQFTNGKVSSKTTSSPYFENESKDSLL